MWQNAFCKWDSKAILSSHADAHSTLIKYNFKNSCCRRRRYRERVAKSRQVCAVLFTIARFEWKSLLLWFANAKKCSKVHEPDLKSTRATVQVNGIYTVWWEFVLRPHFLFPINVVVVVDSVRQNWMKINSCFYHLTIRRATGFMYKNRTPDHV